MKIFSFKDKHYQQNFSSVWKIFVLYKAMNPNQQLPERNFFSKHLTAIIIVAVVFGSCALCGIIGIVGSFLIPQKPQSIANSSTPIPVSTQSPTTSIISTPLPIGSNELRLSVAADIRHYLKDQDIPAQVVASGTKLTVNYEVAQIEYAPDTFFKQQGTAGMARIANAGFETLVFVARGSNGRSQRKEFSVTNYRTK